jgi:PadR family transcriptional regulator, regulatory protein AphA
VKIGVLGHVLLGLLTAGERTGYELTRDFDVSLANVWAARHSQIYPELAKLEAAALIRKTDAGPRGSQRYAITPAGADALRTWLSETNPADNPRTEWMVRVFFLGLLAPEKAASYFEVQQRMHAAKLERYREYAEHCSLDDETTRWSRIALEAGIRHESAMADWAAWAIAEIQRPSSLPKDVAGQSMK